MQKAEGRINNGWRDALLGLEMDATATSQRSLLGILKMKFSELCSGVLLLCSLRCMPPRRQKRKRADI